MGFGSERVMGVGLPLLQALTTAEFRAVVAHEFGHFHGGDTRLGPWLYKTRSAIGRTLAAFEQKRSWLGKPFEWYGHLFLRITHAVSRQQEFAADALAAGVAGAEHLVSGLTTIHGMAPAFPSFWTTEVVPALKAGVRPPIAEGFRRFTTSPAVATQIQSLVAQELAQGTLDPYDTHPPLKERIAALRAVPAPSEVHSEPPAISLLGNADQAESALLSYLLPPALHDALKPATWTDLGALVWLPRWRQVVTDNSARLNALSPHGLPALAEPAGALAVQLKLAARVEVAGEKQIAESRFLVGAAIALALDARGFTFTALPGEPVVFARGPLTMLPFQVMTDLASGALSSDAWLAFCAESGIDSIRLGDDPTTKASPGGSGI
jgi:hypothetical protein